MSINTVGKNACIEHNIIVRSYKFLEAGEHRSYEDALNTSLILMSCAIHLDGKRQIVAHEDGNNCALII